MKKVILFTMMATWMVSCSEHNVLGEEVEQVMSVQKEQETAHAGLVNAYLEKARWGDGNAYLKLAQCYHDGIGYKQDFLGCLTMLLMADQYGATDQAIDSYLMSLNDSDQTKRLLDATARMGRRNKVMADSLVESLINDNSSDAYVLKGIMLTERGDTLGGQQLIQTAAERGSSFADVVLCSFPTPETGLGTHMNIDMLKALSDRIPIVNKLLGDIYSGYQYGETSNIDESKAAFYYRKADQQGYLGRRPARWLINYYDRNGIQIDPQELKRLQTLSGHAAVPNAFIPDSVCIDSEDMKDLSASSSD